MARKILIGMLAVLIGIGIASAGYKFGRYVAASTATDATQRPPV